MPRPITVFAVTSGLILAAAVAFVVLKFGAAVEKDPLSALQIALVGAFALATQIGLFLAPGTLADPRARGWLVMLLCAAWMLVFGHLTLGGLGLGGGQLRSATQLAITSFGALANAFVLVRLLLAAAQKARATASDT
ncbi:hypothetical protein [Niveibacterium sp.]|uniref:hypothetical protein n=1 Tax=Niveibacterium sp. TaxID=2017444 RepID=UPI0035B0BE54